MIRCVLAFLIVLGTANSWAVDPMKPPFMNTTSKAGLGDKKETTTFRLQQIRVSDSGYSAVVNGQLVYEGSRFDGARVLNIREKTLVLAHQGQRKTLSLIDSIKDEVK